MHRRVGHSLSDVVKFALVKSQALSDLQVVLVVLVLQTLGQTAASVDLKWMLLSFTPVLLFTVELKLINKRSLSINWLTCLNT
jgi:hypothetical protein